MENGERAIAIKNDYDTENLLNYVTVIVNSLDGELSTKSNLINLILRKTKP